MELSKRNTVAMVALCCFTEVTPTWAEPMQLECTDKIKGESMLLTIDFEGRSVEQKVGHNWIPLSGIQISQNSVLAETQYGVGGKYGLASRLIVNLSRLSFSLNLGSSVISSGKCDVTLESDVDVFI